MDKNVCRSYGNWRHLSPPNNYKKTPKPPCPTYRMEFGEETHIMRTLSKSKLIAFRQCPKRLWLEIHRSELADDSGSESAFRIGNQVGEIARQIYDPEGLGVLIDIDQMGFDGALEKSAELLKTGTGPVFEAVTKASGALALADVMLPCRQDGVLQWQMIEVKSSTGVKDYHRDDVAIQSYIASEAKVPLLSVALAHVDNSFVYPGGGDYLGLLTEEDLTEEATSRHDEVAEWIAAAQAVAALPEEPEQEPGDQCTNPFACEFCDYCACEEVAPDFPLTSLPRFSRKKKEIMEAQGIDDARGVPDDLLSELQARVKACATSGEVYFDAEGAAADLVPYGFPASFLDFETSRFAVPRWAGTRPYQQLPFQYSLHIVGEDGNQQHESFLDLSGEDPRPALAQSLIDHCGTQGPVFAYYSAFEKRVMRELAECYPDLAPALYAIIDRVVDLLPVARKRYYHPSQHGRWSIKCVLPAAVPDLSYDQLDGICDGGMAMDAFIEATAPGTSAERKAEIEKQLLAYCHLDTLAMVRLWEIFRGGEHL